MCLCMGAIFMLPRMLYNRGAISGDFLEVRHLYVSFYMTGGVLCKVSKECAKLQLEEKNMKRKLGNTGL